jgi:hypothetical protein
MESYQMRLIKEIAEKKNTYLTLAAETPQQEALERLYPEFEKYFSCYRSSLINEVGARLGYGSALKSHKIDPYIAGGAGQAIGGVGAGVYSAVSSANRNAQIDANRAYYGNQVLQTSTVTRSDENNLLNIAKQIDAVLNQVPLIKSFREDILERIYLDAKRNMDSNFEMMVKQAKEDFESIAGYKDAAQLAKKCEQSKAQKRQLKIALCSLAFAAVVLLVSGVISCGLNAVVTVFLMAFVVSDIILQFMMEK